MPLWAETQVTKNRNTELTGEHPGWKTRMAFLHFVCGFVEKIKRKTTKTARETQKSVILGFRTAVHFERS